MGWIAPAIIAGASLLGSYLSSKNNKKKSDTTTVTQEPLVTEQQQAALDLLSNYTTTGKVPGSTYAPGERYQGSLGAYDLSELEKAGGTSLSNLLSSGSPEMLGLAGDEIRSLLTTDKYDPYSEKGLYSPLKTQTLREIRDAQDRFKQAQAFGGATFGTSTGEGLADIESKGQEQLSTTLAGLYDQFVGRKLSAIPMALQTAATGEDISMGRIGAAYQYGGLERTLQDKQAKDLYADWIRGRQEEESERVRQLAASVQLSQGVDWGAKNLTLPNDYYQSNPWTKVFDSITSMASSYMGSQAAK